MQALSHTRVFEGELKQFEHLSNVTNCAMQFSLYLPPQYEHSEHNIPVLLWLSGLTCTDQNFVQKAGAFARAAQQGWAILCPDTSPRGDDVADDDGWDLGKGAGFYVNATQQPWVKHYQMQRYVLEDLIPMIEKHHPRLSVNAISGHSMGGHGALTIGLNCPERFSSISAFSPITNPIDCPWGEKAFTAYLGADTANWCEYDACHLIKQSTSRVPILIDQGAADSFLKEQLKPENLIKAALSVDYPIQLDIHPGYDHSYFFISTFIEKHLAFHDMHKA